VHDIIFSHRRHLPADRHPFATKTGAATTSGRGGLRKLAVGAILGGMTIRVQASLAAAALLAAAGCASAERPTDGSASVSSGPTFLKLRQRGAVGGVAVTPLRVEEDSRCPASVQCIQAGNVRLSVGVGGRGRHVLTLAQPSNIGSGAWLTLCEVVPYPARPGRIGPAAYRFGFVLRRGDAPPACPSPTSAAGG
jgi:hypothetical protein